MGLMPGCEGELPLRQGQGLAHVLSFASRCDVRADKDAILLIQDVKFQPALWAINKARDSARESIPRICIETPDLGVNANTAVRRH
jgi:hypothetical protein